MTLIQKHKQRKGKHTLDISFSMEKDYLKDFRANLRAKQDSHDFCLGKKIWQNATVK